jgi:hypothetical protein
MLQELFLGPKKTFLDWDYSKLTPLPYISLSMLFLGPKKTFLDWDYSKLTPLPYISLSITCGLKIT